MENFPNKRRRSLRLKDYDYSRAGAYFLTICSFDKKCLFGNIVNGGMQLNNLGMIVEQEWLRTPGLRPQTELDAYAVMPNHFHEILFIDDSRTGVLPDSRAGVLPDSRTGVLPDSRTGVLQYAPTNTARKFRSPSQTVGAIIRGFKSAVTTRINGIQKTYGLPVWQRNYYEHVIRSEQALNKIREYIAANPLQWEFDSENPLLEPDSNRRGKGRAVENDF